MLEAFQTILKRIYRYLQVTEICKKIKLGSNYNRSCDFYELLYFFKKQLKTAHIPLLPEEVIKSCENTAFFIVQ